MPLRLRKLHTLPVIVAGGILLAELHAPRLTRRALCCGDMGLKLDGIGTRRSDRIDIRMCHAEAAVVRLCHFGNDPRLPFPRQSQSAFLHSKAPIANATERSAYRSQPADV